MNRKLTALLICLLTLSANILCVGKTLETFDLAVRKNQLIVIIELIPAIVMIYFMVKLAQKIAAQRRFLIRQSLPVSSLRFDRSEFRFGFLKRRISSQEVL